MSEILESYSRLDDLMSKIVKNKMLMTQDLAYNEKYLNSIQEMKQELDGATELMLGSYKRFQEDRMIEAAAMRHCDDLMESVIKLEKEGIDNELSITEWNNTITTIVSYSLDKYKKLRKDNKCPPNVKVFLEDKKRCAKSDLREKFVGQALKYVTTTNDQEKREARSAIFFTINLCNKAHLPVPVWFTKLYKKGPV